MEQLKKKVRIVPMTNEYLNDVAELERTCFSNPWSRNMLAEELENACSAFLVALDAENGSVVGYAGLLAVADEGCITKRATMPPSRCTAAAASAARAAAKTTTTTRKRTPSS